MLLKYKLKGTTSTHGIVFDNFSEQEVSDEIAKVLLANHPAWFEDITPNKKAETKTEVKPIENLEKPQVIEEVEQKEEPKKSSPKKSK